MFEDSDGWAVPGWIAGPMTPAERRHRHRVLVALLRLHTDPYVVEWLCEHQGLPLEERAVREAIVLADYQVLR